MRNKSFTQHNLIRNNCHHFVVRCMNKAQVKMTTWGVYWIILTKSKFIKNKNVEYIYLPLILVYVTISIAIVFCMLSS